MEMVATFSVYFRISIATKLLKIENLLIEIEAIFIEITIKSNIDYSVLNGIRRNPPGKNSHGKLLPWKRFPWKKNHRRKKYPHPNFFPFIFL